MQILKIERRQLWRLRLMKVLERLKDFLRLGYQNLNQTNNFHLRLKSRLYK